jgi:protein tyrosine phosphatase (PTP) superfamily phosphohydrolase (DUF442 family)
MTRRTKSIGRLSAALAAVFGTCAGALDPPEDPERIEAAGVENLYRLGPGLYSGAQPEGEAGFSALKRLGVRTIISVDGATPDVDAARRQGIRYVHLPVGYDGIPPEQAVRLVKAVRDLPGPAFIHCHHGKHRGPAAAALGGVAAQGWTREQARSWLEKAGTSPAYRGLFASVDRFVPPSDADLARLTEADLPERAEVPDLVEAMVRIDAHWDHLQAVQKAGFRPPRDAPDLDPPHEALMLAEQFRELLRQDATRARGGDFLRAMDEAREAATDLEATLRTLGPAPTEAATARVESAFKRSARSCTSCHARYRDR